MALPFLKKTINCPGHDMSIEYKLSLFRPCLKYPEFTGKLKITTGLQVPGDMRVGIVGGPMAGKIICNLNKHLVLLEVNYV